MAQNQTGTFSKVILSAALAITVFCGGGPALANVGSGAQPLLIPPVLDRAHILMDADNRISDSFKIPENLRERVGFWFDIYTKYNSLQHVIHYADYPWIVFDIVDAEPILDGPGNKWVKFHKAEKEVHARKRQVIALLNKMARLKDEKKYTPEMAAIAELMRDIPGRRPHIYKRAAQNIRTQLGQKDFFETGLINASKYIPEMEKIFDLHELPHDLTRLPLVESSFNEGAVSKVGASGVWQLMPSMGHELLFVQGAIDERNSPLKATDAAAKILKENFQMMKSWPLAMTAYNHGPKGLKQAEKRFKTNDLAVLIEKYKGGDFGFATSNFYCEFLAALHAERYQREAFGKLPLSSPMAIRTIPLPHSYRLRTLSQMAGISLDDIAFYNPELRDDDIRGYTFLPKGFKLLLPPQSVTALEKIPAPKRIRHASKKASRLPVKTALTDNNSSGPQN